MKAPKPLLLVAQKLGPLRERVVFVGGMIRGLLTTDPAAGPTRPTDDVDLIVRSIDSIADYHALGTELRKLGFHEDTREDAPLCRWVVDGVTTDIMPIDPAVFGFSNVWYESAQHHVATTNTTDGDVFHLDGPHFCATKLEAFESRGGGELLHHDLEDFIALVDERPTLIAELKNAPAAVRDFLAKRVSYLLSSSEFLEALPGHLRGDDASQQRLPAIVAKLNQIAALKEQPQTPAREQFPGVMSAARRQAIASPVVLSQHSSSRVSVRSSNLAWVEYLPMEQRLLIGFRSRAIYSYAGVPVGIYQGLLAAASKGRFFHVWIRDRYATRRLR